MFKIVLPLVFLLLADGQAAKEEAPKPPSGLHRAPGPAVPAAPEPRKRVETDKPHGKAPSGVRPDRTERDRELPHGDAGGSRSGELGGEHRDVASVSKRPAVTGKDDHGKEDRGVPEGERPMNPAAGLSAHAMRDELGQRAGMQKAASERERLELLSTDLARARTALREETARLESLMERARQSGVIRPGAPGGAAAGGAGAGSGEGGGPMPVGDPLAPNAYFRPQPPPANFAVQVEVVSKAIKSMKPEQAAGIIGHLERGLAAEVLQRMRPADAGAILGFLKPEVGAALAAEILSRPPVGAGKAKDADKEKP